MAESSWRGLTDMAAASRFKVVVSALPIVVLGVAVSSRC
jgi:hypothetical protein